MRRKMHLDSVSIILVKPKFPENIGSVARAMKNMGLSRLVVVNGCSPLLALKWGVWSEQLHVGEKRGSQI
jgi:tRNA C32,U32 (ribose-2'-O)-methylase TrmJ